MEGSFLKVISHLEKNYLIILDDFGLQPLDANSRLALLQILEERYERKSMIIFSQSGEMLAVAHFEAEED